MEMKSKELKEKLQEKLKNLNRNTLLKLQVLSLFDFVIDHLIYIDDFQYFSHEFRRVLKGGGGELENVKHTVMKGGCGLNTACCLGRLGISSSFICRTSDSGLSLLKYFLQDQNVDISHVKTDGDLVFTAIFEIGNENVNVMISETDSNIAIGFEDLNQSDLKLIRACEMVGIFDWFINKKGTDLAAGILQYAQKYSVKTFIDTGDPFPKRDEVNKLFEYVLSSKYLNVLSVNANELDFYSNFLSAGQKCTSFYDKAMLIKGNIHASLDLHTNSFSATFNKHDYCIVPTFNIFQKRSTGAGDAWNGGNILGYLLQLDPEERLLFANAVAGYYISSDKPEYPNIEQLVQFIIRAPVKKIDFEKYC
jgi:2-dehydro-3-deoxygluconokinase